MSRFEALLLELLEVVEVLDARAFAQVREALQTQVELLELAVFADPQGPTLLTQNRDCHIYSLAADFQG
jgi:hypothetical protein